VVWEQFLSIRLAPAKWAIYPNNGMAWRAQRHVIVDKTNAIFLATDGVRTFDVTRDVASQSNVNYKIATLFGLVE